jgi:formylglycine-generating enzyme required for sulfatase activity
LDTSLHRCDAQVKARFAECTERRGIGLRWDPGSAMTQLVRHPEDGKLMTLVDAGVFLAGRDAQPVWVGTFYIDVYPTSNADYARFLAATDREPPQHWSSGGVAETRPRHPVVGVSWHDARAYAEWASKQLPTGLEWEKAARGVSGATYPWGDTAAPTRCNVRESWIGSTTPVDWYDGASPYGLYDVCGNVWEWCLSGSCDLCELRGGAFTSSLHLASPSSSRELAASTRRPDVGFRCAASLTSMLELLSI